MLGISCICKESCRGLIWKEQEQSLLGVRSESLAIRGLKKKKHKFRFRFHED